MLRRKMIKIFFSAAVALSSLVSVEGQVKPRAVPEPAAAREIRRVLERQVAAWNRRDLEGFMQGYWHSPELTFYSGGSKVAGWKETLDRYRNRYMSAGNEMGKLDFLDLKIELLGPKAGFVRGRFQLKMGTGNSEGLFTLTLRRFSDGWKIVHDHTSTS